MKKNFLTIKGLTKVYNAGVDDKITALSNFTLSLNEGDFITIVGSNAAGKSTLFKLISGAITPTSGEIILDGVSLSNFNESQRAKVISCVRQNPNESVINSMTIAENLALVKLKKTNAGLYKGVKREWRKEFASLLRPLGIGLEKRLDDRMDSLSGGQKQTVALLMAMLARPKLLLLDEHTAALDPKVSKLILKITNEIVKKNMVTTLMITHNIYQAIEYGDRLILLERGRISFEISGKEKKSLNILDLEGYFKGDINE